jgi:hypothetical protein
MIIFIRRIFPYLLRISVQTEPDVAASSVLRFKIAIQQKDEKKAAEIVDKMMSCRDFDADYLK